MSIGGALRGMGKQKVATQCVFAGFFLIGHPISLLLCFYFDLGMLGITLGFICGSISMGGFFYIAVKRTSWVEISREVRKKMKDDGGNQKDAIENGELKVSLIH